MIGGSLCLGIYFGATSQPVNLRQFPANSDISQYIQSHRPPPLIGGPMFDGGILTSTLSGNQPRSATAGGTSGYSTTNVQVEGVDEPDVVKTDGRYIYAIIEDDIVVIDAFPKSTAQIASRVHSDISPQALFLFQSSKLVLIASNYYVTVLEIYDISNPTSIVQNYELTVTGRYRGARLIGESLYLIVSDYAYDRGQVHLPIIMNNHNYSQIPVEEIYHDPGEYDWSYYFQMIIALDISDPEETLDIETVLTGGSTCTLYTSLFNIYLALSQYPFFSRNWFDRQTTIHRFGIADGEVNYEASGKVSGYLLNQFSLDEMDGYLRVATTSWVPSVHDEALRIQVSNICVLDMQLDVVGRLEGLAPGEQIYSVRFLGTTGYLVTFWKIDPLFIIDLSNPYLPRLMGELVMPGYSDYLHPFGNGILLGLGKETVVSESGDFWWYQGVKISLFNTTDPYSPEEADRMVIGVRGTDSEALHNHRAILVDTQEGLFGIPICINDYIDQPNPEPNSHGIPVWQGFQVFDVNTTEGSVTLRGEVTHLSNLTAYQESSWDFRSEHIWRGLYIGEVLYTLSNLKLAYHNLSDLSFIGELELT